MFPSSFQNKTRRQEWREEDMASAISAVESGQMGWMLASNTFKVPKTTLRRRVTKNKGNKKGYLGGFKVTFSPDLEAELASHVLELETRFFGMTRNELRKLVFELAQKHNLPHRFNKEKGMAGKKWFRGFLVRNPTISIRTPENTSTARSQAFNKENVKAYFKALAELLDEHNFEPQDIFNVDETGMGTVPTRNQKILATKGRKQVGTISSAERGLHYTAVCCFNALGTFVPPAFIFPRKRFKAELMDNAPSSSVAYCQEKGWMTSELFLRWLTHFVHHIKPSKDNKVLLLLDGHCSHKGLDVLEYAKDNGIVIFCFPAHCTHRLQPLDVGFFAPLQTYYNQEIQKWMKQFPGRTVTHFQVAGLFKNAYLKAAIPLTAINAFQKTGIVPFNPDVFEEWHFAPSLVTDKGDMNNMVHEAHQSIEKANIDGEGAEGKKGKSDEGNMEIDMDEIKGRQINENEENNKKNQREANVLKSRENLSQPSCSFQDSIEELSPLPKASNRTSENTQRKRRRGKTGLMNSTPDINELKKKKIEVLNKERMALARSAKKKIESMNEDENECDEEMEIDDDSDVACLYCNELYSRSRSREFWIKCQNCSGWCHAECADVSRKTKQFICDVCK